MDLYLSAERCVFMHAGMEWEDLQLGLFAGAGSFLPPPQGCYRNLRNGCLCAKENTNTTSVSPLKNAPSAAKLPTQHKA